MEDSTLIKSARGSLYNIIVAGATILLGFLRTVLLMRWLEPDDFGVLGLSLFFITLLTPFAAFGLDNALLQEKEPTRSSYSTHFALRLGLGSLAVLFGLLAAPALIYFYSDRPLIVTIFLILLLLTLVEATYATPAVVLRRELRFGALALINLAASLAMTLVAPLLAWAGAGIWSLVAEQAVGPLVRWTAIYLFIRPWRVSVHLDRQKARQSLQFGSRVTGSHLLGVILDRFDDFWTGTYLGTTALGYYSRAYEMAQYPERILANPIVNVFSAAYARLQDDRLQLSRAFFRSSSFLVRAGFLLAGILFVSASEITIILFTETWLPLVPIFQLMLVYIVLDPLYVNLSYLLVSVGFPGILLRVRLVQVLLFIAAVAGLGALWGTAGVAVAANVMMLTGVVLLFGYSRRFVSFSFFRMLLWPSLALLAAMTLTYAAQPSLSGLGLWNGLLLNIALLTLIYGSVLYLAERRLFNNYFRQAHRLIRERRLW
jgi:PST family polysaccharide transporter